MKQASLQPQNPSVPPVNVLQLHQVQRTIALSRALGAGWFAQGHLSPRPSGELNRQLRRERPQSPPHGAIRPPIYLLSQTSTLPLYYWYEYSDNFGLNTWWQMWNECVKHCLLHKHINFRMGWQETGEAGRQTDRQRRSKANVCRAKKNSTRHQ